MGSYHMVDGFLLSNQLTDFAANPIDAQGRWVANRVEGNKRPRSTMTPMLVLKDNNFYLATGSPGGSAIIQYVVKSLVADLDWQLDPQQAANLVNFGANNSATTNVDGSNTQLDLSALVAALQVKGHRISQGAQTSGIATIRRDANGRYVGGVDPRREGLVLGNGAL